MTTSEGTRPIVLVGAWFALLGGALAWSAYHLLSYLVVIVACDTGGLLWLLAITGATGVVSGASALVGFTILRRVPGDPRGEHGGTSRAAVRFLGRCGIWLGLIFLVTILLTSASLLFLHPCQ
jgi:hypothetical protein